MSSAMPSSLARAIAHALDPEGVARQIALSEAWISPKAPVEPTNNMMSPVAVANQPPPLFCAASSALRKIPAAALPIDASICARKSCFAISRPKMRPASATTIMVIGASEVTR